MKKSLVIIASALILAVGAAGTQRLRYDATVFANAERVSQAVGRGVVQAEYPPCVRGVREDRCIQLYERGVRRSYARWLAARGAGSAEATTAPAVRRYRPCRSRTDDNCRQVPRTRSAGVARRAAPIRAAVVRRAVPARAAPARRAAASRAAPPRAASAARTRWTRAATAQRQARAAQQRRAAASRAAAAPSRPAVRRPAQTARSAPAVRRAPQTARSAPPATPRPSPPPPVDRGTPGI